MVVLYFRGVIEVKEGEVRERHLPTTWGLNRSLIVEARKAHLTPKVDWRYEREVIVRPSGLVKLQRHFGLDEGAEESPAVMEGDVVKWDWRNSRMVEVMDGKGTKRIVRVRNALLWRPDRRGQFMRMKFFKDGDVYRQTGRSPRYPGVW